MKEVGIYGGIIFILLGAGMIIVSYFLRGPEQYRKTEWRINQDKWSELDKEFMCEVSQFNSLYRRSKKVMYKYDSASEAEFTKLQHEMEECIEREKALSTQMKQLSAQNKKLIQP